MTSFFSEYSASENAGSSVSGRSVSADASDGAWQRPRRTPDAALPVTLINAPLMTWPQKEAAAGFELKPGCVVIQQGRILDVSPVSPASLLLNHDNVSIVTLPKDSILTPGLIDLQLNGAFGIDLNHASLKQVASLLWQLPKYGVTHALATLISAPLTDMLCAVQLLEEAASISPDGSLLEGEPETLVASEMLGIHLEGPFLNTRYSGVHPVEAIGSKPPSLIEMKALFSPSVRMMTFAPERDPAGELLQFLVQNGVTPMAGHCNPEPEQLRAAVSNGLRGVTHLFNAMPPFHHRSPGCLPEVLLNADLYTTVIGDGEHVAREAMRLLQAVKSPNRLVLVSDAMALAACRIGDTCQFASQTVTRVGNRAVNAVGQLAGSVLLLNEVVAFLSQQGWLPFERAVYQASAAPADLLGESHRLGRIAPGLEASLVVWQAGSCEVLATWQQGQLAYHRPYAIAGLSTSTLATESLSRVRPSEDIPEASGSEACRKIMMPA